MVLYEGGQLKYWFPAGLKTSLLVWLFRLNCLVEITIFGLTAEALSIAY